MSELTTMIDGRRILENSYDPYVDLSLHHPGTVMPRICIGDDVGVYTEDEYIPLRIDRYSYRGRVFCYLVEVAPYLYDDLTGVGGSAAAAYTFAFYDEDGNGRFETREFANIMIGAPDQFRLKLPQWVMNLPAKD
jgi:hypothetical protein